MKRIYRLLAVNLILLFLFFATPVCTVWRAVAEENVHHFAYLNMEGVREETTGEGVTIAVIDTGVDTDHVDLNGKISELSYNASRKQKVKQASGSCDWSVIVDPYGHGTAVCGSILSDTVGIAPNVQLIVIKVEIKNNVFPFSDLNHAITYAVEQDVDIISMSFGAYEKQDPFAETIALAEEAGIVCVAAAGNGVTVDGSSVGVTTACYPAANDYVIGVGSLDKDSWELAEYSNYGVNTSIVAPGTVYTVIKDGEYGDKRGTSYSTPVVAGAVALYLSKYPQATCQEVKDKLFASAKDLGDAGKDDLFGYGALDVKAFLAEEVQEPDEPIHSSNSSNSSEVSNSSNSSNSSELSNSTQSSVEENSATSSHSSTQSSVEESGNISDDSTKGGFGNAGIALVVTCSVMAIGIPLLGVCLNSDKTKKNENK